MTQTYQMTRTGDNPLTGIIQMVTDGLTSPNSKRNYTRALDDFMTWWTGSGKPKLNKAVVQRYKTEIQDRYAPATVNLALSAIRRLALEAADNGYLDAATAGAIERVKGVTSHGVRSGNWLSKEDAQTLINIPNTTTLKGLRDRALLAVMLGAGLRRSEVAALNFEHIQQRDGRWVIVDLVGKGNRVRSVPMPSWAKAAVDGWTQAAAISGGRVFRAIHKGGYLDGESITPQAVHDAVKVYLAMMGINAAPHDLRRTFAKLARKGGSSLEQIQMSLGHASVITTERYLGMTQDLTDAPCDRLGLSLD
ncbi:MAG TPA: tyrosine-type recombinase/integrase [Anaerolineales bacterium]|jgi:site-specific recombinase XerD